MIADALLHASIFEPTSTDSMLQKETAAFVKFILNHLPVIEGRSEKIIRLQSEDNEC